MELQMARHGRPPDGRLPANQEAERFVLAAILYNRAPAYTSAAEILTPEDFSNDRHRRLFRFFGDLVKRGVPIELVAISEELFRTKELEAVGGMSYVSDMTQGVSPSVTPAYYAGVVKDYAGRRALFRLSETVREQALDAGIELSASLDYLRDQGQKMVAAQYRDGVWTESILPFRSASQIQAETPPKVDFIARPWLAAGVTTELDGKVKAAGKTTWLLAMCRAILDGEHFMGEPTRKTPIVYLTEENQITFRVALERAGLLGREDFIVLYWSDTLGTGWEAVVREAVSESKRRGARLLVVDTLAQFAGLEGDDENNAGDALRAIQPLKLAAAKGLGVVFTRHERKGGGEVGDSGRGSTAFGGAVDTILSIGRPGGNSRPTLRVIKSLSRLTEVPGQLVIERTDAGYVAHGTTQAVAAKEAEGAILAAAPDSEGDAFTPEALYKAARTSKSTGQRVVKSLYRKGKLARSGKGKKGDPYRYYLARIHSAQTTNVYGAERKPEQETPDTTHPAEAEIEV